MGVLLGFDPGGLEAFGWCVVEDAEELPLRFLEGGIAQGARDAFEAVVEHSDVLAAGIDSPLFWTTSGRRVDSVLRDELKTRAPSAAGTVQAVNSLRGACLVQGVLLAMLLRERWPGLRISESHPKAYLWLKGDASRDCHPRSVRLASLDSVSSIPPDIQPDDHVRDSAIAALSAWAMIHEPPRWRDLFLQEENPYMPIGPPLGYWMPELQAELGLRPRHAGQGSQPRSASDDHR